MADRAEFDAFVAQRGDALLRTAYLLTADWGLAEVVNPTRRMEVRSRIVAIRRRRIAGAALGLVLLAVGGLLALARLPGRSCRPRWRWASASRASTACG
jgi:hypothetical protein